ncbi:ClpXP adapter SpxH family protein [Jeotgalibacillus terrae]|uniref:ClpXP adapter protein SpxH n=1 Tax=Jeotgalibacillus terrae TaxID=587735 RepID=A0ABW5ZIT6_9BACL|nr:ClpXP adapter SpxH family protein [Jeotgalibacillus terrae]MBM7579747.1 putative DsbA family dithiol-disulfide isomerase [Jeotgalibacillus terrae]
MSAKKWTDASWYSQEQRPLEIYLFIDPLSSDCWALEPKIKKLLLEYEPYLRIKHILSSSLDTLNCHTEKQRKELAKSWNETAIKSGMPCDGSQWIKNPVESPFLASVAVKAAEMQGKKAGSRFLRSIQEQLFVEQKNISDFDVLLTCAEKSRLDIDEFTHDMHSATASKAFQCDVKIASEMDVHSTPTLVFFNENIEDEGIKVDGLYPYEIYSQIVEQMLEEKPPKKELPAIEEFLMRFKIAATVEVAEVYDISMKEAEKRLKKLMFNKKIEKIEAGNGTFWRYIF